ncbi:hypothetical protein GCM10010443_86960 [Actinoplanes cyaneus]
MRGGGGRGETGKERSWCSPPNMCGRRAIGASDAKIGGGLLTAELTFLLTVTLLRGAHKAAQEPEMASVSFARKVGYPAKVPVLSRSGTSVRSQV